MGLRLSLSDVTEKAPGYAAVQTHRDWEAAPNLAQPLECAAFPRFRLNPSGCPPETHLIVHVEQVEPGDDIFAFRSGLLLEFVEVSTALDVGGGALVGHIRPDGDFGIRPFIFCGLLEPFEDFAVALAGGELLFEGFRVDPRE